MPVVVDQRYAAHLLRDGEAPRDAVERRQRLAEHVERHLELVRDGDGGQAIEHVVRARHANDVLAERAWSEPHGVVLTLEHCGELAGADQEAFETALEVLDSVAESCYDEDIPFWVLVDGVDAKAFDLPVIGGNEG